MSEFEEKRKVPESLVADMLQPLKGKAGPLIQDMSPSEPVSKPVAHVATTKEEPTMLELMMAAQREAREEQGKLKETEQKTASKTGFSGFKKGFFGGSASASSKPTQKSVSSDAKASSSVPTSGIKSQTEIIEVKAKTASSAKGGSITSVAKTNSGIVLPEVQSALEAEKNPLLKQLENKEWVTDSLMDKIQHNPILRTGMSHPKCMAAMQLMQSNPKEAMERFKDDVEVTRFLQEFGKVMADHFESLGSKQGADTDSSSTVLPAENVGPLQAEVLKKHANVPKSKIEEVDPEQAKVNTILQDPELREILMDPGMQRVLMECSDPVKFRNHMLNKETARKLHKLKQAGLVQVEM